MSEKRVISEQLLNDYKDATEQLCICLAHIQRLSDMFQKRIPFDKAKLVYVCTAAEMQKKRFITAKKNLGYDDGFQFLEDNRFNGFSVEGGKLISEVSNEEIFKVCDKWFYGYPNTANHYQFEVATYVICLAEVEHTVASMYPEGMFYEYDE
jgi:hypothetical protein